MSFMGIFNFHKHEIEKNIEWNPTGFQFIEAWSFPNVNEVTSWNFRHGCLESSQLKEWLQQTGKLSTPSYPLSEQPNGGIRLLICNYTLFERVSLGMSREDYKLVEAGLALHPATLSALEVNGGMFSRYSWYAGQQGHRRSIILKAPQKYEIANYMLSLTHDPASQWTTALLAGEDIIDLFPSMEDHRSELSFRSQAPGRTIRAGLAQSPEMWNNPLTLPCILVTDHLKRLQQYCTGSLTQQVMVIEEHLGVTTVGRRNQVPRFRGSTNRRLHSKDADVLNLGIPVNRSQTHFLTVSINSKLTSILFTKLSPKWNHEASRFLLNIVNESSGEWRGQNLHDNQIRELIEHNVCLAKSIEDHVLCLQARMELQLDVLYSFVAQSDNRLNARLAASTGRDSTSMKILAFITTIFLPGTFIATLFSMDMFDWKSAPSDDSSAVSSQFWIYWATAVPLTAVTLGGWALWWNFEKHRYDVHITEAVHRADRPYKSWWRKR
ncbi:hypothetical protein F9C07_2280560 [Aspergillus flavus]|uniref:Uncharacterized protein n=1 Tax=Aspergillus flavus (strain ATCC 200026 / FGSC A1120 / IAM 13836 / NRRL 3357 / JCM 12722 / SRRC 167) TaxID=332952 RepID=A0A7G5KGM7_ASPFN|nr:uncharacterized protein G4B84_010435 [Aspergillus flavus NRRL3357]QMW34944.1 hypothetical protein G4B84_010435 [Aspergillus flavus NRRL3357]QMW47019.1 hypothetical protein G4B11_010498 [Aspergillus flavus]QRD91280.1 hypothetical protein F9C07_2280560 [Aspergillus flavus]